MTMPGQPSQPIILYGFKRSGHCHRVELFLNLAQLPYRYVEVNLSGGEHKRPEFLAMNRFAQVPVIDDGGVVLADSNAILVYLAGRYAPRWYPAEVLQHAQIQRWFSAAAGLLAFGPAMARAIALFRPTEDARDAITRAHRLFAVMDAELVQHQYLIGNQPTLADIAMYSYTAHAPEGKVSLEQFANIQTWLSRIETLPGFIPMPIAGTQPV
ncbi:MAG: glutathione S-transferase [Steroidobacter sp.]